MDDVSDELKKIKSAFNKVRLDIIRIERKIDKNEEEQKRYIDNIEKMINDRIDVLTREFKRDLSQIKKDKSKKEITSKRVKRVKKAEM